MRAFVYTFNFEHWILFGPWALSIGLSRLNKLNDEADIQGQNTERFCKHNRENHV